jgi:hypothetical protein
MVRVTACCNAELPVDFAPLCGQADCHDARHIAIAAIQHRRQLIMA